MKKSFYDALLEEISETQVKKEEQMSKHTTFRVGGSADYFIDIDSERTLISVQKLCKEYEIPYYVIGNGSNLLVGDNGYRGAVLRIFSGMNRITVIGNLIKVEAGAILSKVAKEALDHGLKGFEFAAGIPGTIGGAVVMNAGAYGGEMKDVIQSVTVVTRDGQVKELGLEELELGYRTSIIAKKSYTVTEVVLRLEAGEKSEIQTYMDELKAKRVDKQPLEYPSAGSTFKRPEGYFAGKLIEDAGFRGFQVGGAQVSEKHCGFVINKEKATADDIVKLMNQIVKKVELDMGVTLSPEVKRIGEFIS